MLLMSHRHRAIFLWIMIFLSVFLRVLFMVFTDLLPEEAYYWNYAMHLDYSYLDHPPMVALLIKLSMLLFGMSEFSIRFPALICWVITVVFSYKFTVVVLKFGKDCFSVFLLSFLPYFFIQSMIITPDLPLMACWSAALYCLYRALELDEAPYWYGAGLSMGLGLLSKYTMVLFAPSILLYMIFLPSARHWFLKKEPYLCALISLLLFMPVIYWNATHDWVSFAFQGARRFQEVFQTSIHLYFGLLLLFLTPVGVLATWRIVKEHNLFLYCFVFFPLAFFGLFSITHDIKFNWIGPPLLALIPWFSASIVRGENLWGVDFKKGWMITACVLMLIYAALIGMLSTGKPHSVYHIVFKKFISWRDLTEQFNAVAAKIEQKTKKTPIMVPLELYNIISEITYYQAKGMIKKPYPVLGCHVFGGLSLMYSYWDKGDNLTGKTLILISPALDRFENADITKRVIDKSPVMTLWAHSQDLNESIRPYYYKVVKVIN